jgi:hypothetical protein
MATVQRPLKEGSVRTYQEKVGLGFVDILANEMDADLDTIYAAWNGGVDSVTLKDLSVTTPKIVDGAVTTPKIADGQVTYVKLAADAQLWRDTGSALTPGTTFPNRFLSIPVGYTAHEWGSRPIKARLASAAAGDTSYLTINQGLPAGTWVKDDVAKSGWILELDSAGDVVHVSRSAPGSSTLTSWLTLTGVGDLTVMGAINAGAGAAVTGGFFQASGTAGGLRCKGVGSVAGDGYSNAIGFGWDGTLKARVDSTVIGTVTVTSDARVKINVQEDVPGLDAVLAMRPISFEYDQTKREIGFATGRHYGLIAQEVESLAPLAVEDDASEDHWKELDYRALVPVLIRAIQDLAQRLTAAAT